MGGVVSPFKILCGDDDAGAAHVEGFREGVVYLYAVNDHLNMTHAKIKRFHQSACRCVRRCYHGHHRLFRRD